VVLADPELLEAEAIEVGGEVEIALVLQGRVLAEWVMGGEEGSELQTCHAGERREGATGDP